MAVKPNIKIKSNKLVVIKRILTPIIIVIKIHSIPNPTRSHAPLELGSMTFHIIPINNGIIIIPLET